MALVFLEQREKNLPDSLSDNNYQSFGSGSGDRRFNVPGNWEMDPHVYDFYLENVEFYFFTRNDLLDYIHSIQEEINHPTQKYTKLPNSELKTFYDKKLKEVSEMSEITTLHFVASSRTGGTSYIANDNEIDGEIYNRFREICLSSSKQGPKNAYTTYRFVKYKDTTTGKCYINLIPIFSKQYSMEELSKILNRDFDITADWHTFIYVFGMKYAEHIMSQNISCEKLVNLAGINNEQVAIELQRAVNLFQHLKERKISINPIDDKLNILGAYLQIQALDSTHNNLSNPNNFEISSSYRPLITAIKTKPFLLLAGISGTGKSRIVRELAFKSCPKFLQDKEGTTPGNYCMIEVKPNWHDSTELLGYYSRLGKGGYQFTKFVNFLVKAKMFPEVPFFVCLDEMNLAPVEQYFAEILSILETRKHPKNNQKFITTGPIIDATYFKEYSGIKGARNQETGEPYNQYLTDRGIYMKLFNIDTESDIKEEVGSKRDLTTIGLTLPDNVVIIGTVNMDDTTHQFSRKVIDRAMTIEMNGGNLRDMFGGSKDLEYIEDEAEQQKWQYAFAQRYVTADEVLEAHQEYAHGIKEKLPTRLEEINKALKGTPFEVSYRVLNELTIMVGVLIDDKKASGEDVVLDDIINQALNNILLMKILPRIEGDAEMFAISDENKKKVNFDNRLAWLMALAPDLNSEAEAADTDDVSDSIDESTDVKSKAKKQQYTAKDKINEMIERLDSQEFTRFWP